MITACNYPVRRDIVVYAYSEAAIKARRGVMELLLARAPESEELKALAEKMGIDRTSYPTVTESQRNCILCGLCVRVCEQMIGQSAIGFAGRGVDRTVAAPFRQPAEDCIGCGACAAICPVGTIKLRIHMDTNEIEISPFKSRFKMQLCKECNSPVVSERVTEKALQKLAVNSEDLREILRLCPNCRSLRTAEQLAAMPGYEKE
jgi:NADH dehydrogenase/NADH:ubiquinone oxidoreductase subunit G